MKRNPRQTGINRQQALDAAPVAFPPVRTEKKKGKLYVTVEFVRPHWQRFLGADKLCERTFGLDAYGQEVYAACDGKTPVNRIIDRFAKKHHIDPSEAELNVTTFLKTLIGKGLVGIPLTDQKIPITEGHR
jgi:hypothetical protein